MYSTYTYCKNPNLGVLISRSNSYYLAVQSTSLHDMDNPASPPLGALGHSDWAPKLYRGYGVIAMGMTGRILQHDETRVVKIGRVHYLAGFFLLVWSRPRKLKHQDKMRFDIVKLRRIFRNNVLGPIFVYVPKLVSPKFISVLVPRTVLFILLIAGEENLIQSSDTE